MKKLKHEAELTKLAMKVGMKYAENRGAARFEATDSADDKIEYIYRLLVHDQLIQPLAKDDLTLPSMKHKLALWISRQLPPDHELLK